MHGCFHSNGKGKISQVTTWLLPQLRSELFQRCSIWCATPSQFHPDLNSCSVLQQSSFASTSAYQEQAHQIILGSTFHTLPTRVKVSIPTMSVPEPLPATRSQTHLTMLRIDSSEVVPSEHSS